MVPARFARPELFQREPLIVTPPVRVQDVHPGVGLAGLDLGRGDRRERTGGRLRLSGRDLHGEGLDRRGDSTVISGGRHAYPPAVAVGRKNHLDPHAAVDVCALLLDCHPGVAVTAVLKTHLARRPAQNAQSVLVHRAVSAGPHHRLETFEPGGLTRQLRRAHLIGSGHCLICRCGTGSQKRGCSHHHGGDDDRSHLTLHVVGR